MAHEEAAAFRNLYELIHRHRAEAPNALWQADHTPLDILIVDANGKRARNYRSLTGDELTFLLTRPWRSLGINIDNTDLTGVQAVATIARVTGANFRLPHRLFTQIERIKKINKMTVITDDVGEAPAAPSS